MPVFANDVYTVERWASGGMAGATKKRLETMKRKREAEALLGTPGIAKSSPGPVGILKHAQQQSSSPTQAPAHRARKRFAVSEKLARLFEDNPALDGAAASVAWPDLKVDGELRGSPLQAGYPTPSVEMLGAKPPLRGYASSDLDGTGVLVEDDGIDEDGSHFLGQAKTGKEAAGESVIRLAPIEMASPERPYTKWRGVCPCLFSHLCELALTHFSRCRWFTAGWIRRAYPRRLPTLHNEPGTSMGLRYTVLPEGVYKSVPTRLPFQCKWAMSRADHNPA